MKSTIKSIWNESKSALFLVAVVTVCVTLLYFVNRFTAEPRLANEKMESDLAVAELLASIDYHSDESVSLSPVEGFSGVAGSAELPENAGTILSLQGRGYGDKIVIMALYKNNGDFLDAMIVDHSETDGIGSRITEKGYMRRFAGYGAASAIPATKRQVKPEYADSISGATVSFSAVANILQKGSDYIKQKKSDGENRDER